MGSKRFPGKVLENFNGLPLIAHIIHLAESLPFDYILATPSTEDNHPLWIYATSLGAKIFKGSDEDVLDRFYQCARSYSADIIIRLCADTPLITRTDVLLQLAYHEQINRFTYGNGVYIMSMEDLEEAWVNAKHPDQREHIIPYMIRCIDYPEDIEKWQKV